MKKVLLIIPAFNEEANILPVARKLDAFCSSHKGQNPDYSIDYIVINDGSGDRTAEICRNNDIPVISLVKNLGIGGAVQTGYKYALQEQYDVAVQFDGDGQHDIESLDQVILPILRNEADFTVGSRFIEKNEGNFQSTRFRRMGIFILSGVMRLFGRVRILDCTSGYRGAGRCAIAYLSEDYPVDYPEPESLIQIAKRGYRIVEVPVTMFEREGGTSSIRLWKSCYYMIKVTLAIMIASIQRKENH
ncbi:MAG: glycosyl transferase, group 2 family protein [Oscillospiraceae bacterium]|nr:glycosyl transferase, group 2 family protein [Oscillospiraceae bacterium]